MQTYSGNEGNFPHCFQKAEKQIIIHRHWHDCRSESTGLTGATRSLSTIRKLKRRNSRQLCPRQTWAYQPEGHFKRQSPETIGSTPDIRRLETGRLRLDPGIQGLDPRCMETGPPRDKTTRPSTPRMRTKDFVGSRTSWDSGLHGIQDFAGPRTS